MKAVRGSGRRPWRKRLLGLIPGVTEHAIALLDFARVVLVGCSLTAVASGALAQQPGRTLRVIAANAVKDGLQQLAAHYQQQSGQRVEIIWSGTESAERRVGAGERFDAVLIGSDAIDRLVTAGHLTVEGKVAVARTGVAVAVRSGYPRPAIDTADAVRSAVLAAPRVAYSAGPSGVYVHTLLSRLGVGEQVASKLTRPSSGAEVAQLVARGEVDLAFAQVSEFNPIRVPGSLRRAIASASASPRSFDVSRSPTRTEAWASVKGEGIDASMHATLGSARWRAMRETSPNSGSRRSRRRVEIGAAERQERG